MTTATLRSPCPARAPVVARECRPRPRRLWWTAVCIGALAAGPCAADGARDLRGLSIEELLEIEVTSASRHAEPWGETPAAVDVITADEIERSGATSLPELLRLAAGVQVARIDGSQWAISARGFNSLYANKLLVMIDGRSVYNDLFSGVYWDSRELPLADIERIEIIRGPGGAVWGANAVNGVINVITRNARDTQGGYVRATAGDTTPAWLTTARWGGELARGAYRVWGRGLDRGEVRGLDGSDIDADAFDRRGGFRIDLDGRAGGRWMISGDAFRGGRDDRVSQIDYVPPYAETFVHASRFSGESLVARWEGPRAEHGGSRHSVQVNFDRTHRNTGVYDDTATMLEIEYEVERAIGARHKLALGAGARRLWTTLRSTRTVWSTDEDQTFDLWSAFVQDDWSLAGGDLVLSGGLKLEHNEFSGLEPQPSIRLAWRLSDATFAWAATSRAVRTPSRGEGRLTVDVAILPGTPLPTLIRAIQRGEVDSEKLTAWEIGARHTLGAGVSLDATLFYHRYRDLLSLLPTPGGLDARAPVPVAELDFVWNNASRATVWGAELAARWSGPARCAWSASYTYLSSRVDDAFDATGGFVFFGQEDLSPRHQVGVEGSCAVAPAWQLAVAGRWVDSLDSSLASLSPLYPVSRVPSYAEADLSVSWDSGRGTRLELAGRNLLHDDHLEFIDFAFGSPATRIPRRIQLSGVFTF
ncbi:MAG: TonB-dependent receptor [Acidobacteria bacterium]|nr:MAG: TonB-dependent receptor [Acidobacteriota bacterium]